MIIATLHEPEETRVAITPNSAKQYIKSGFDVYIESHAGEASGFSDENYQANGVHTETDKAALLRKTNVLVLVNEPAIETLSEVQANTLIISHIEQESSPLINWCKERDIRLFSMNHIPRISRAQNIDSLSSQSNLAGYRAVIEGVYHYHRAVPMMMTSAGMIHPAKVLVLGAGVAGLQAIATAKRLGAVVYAFDVRSVAKEQVMSLGAEFIEVGEEQDNESKGGYATTTSEAYQIKQASLIEKYATLADIVICTALIPQKPAPLLLPKAIVEKMKAGAIIVDLATARKGNCGLSIRDKITTHGQVTIIGYSNMSGKIPTTASDLYANNLLNLIRLITRPDPLRLNIDKNDEIIQQALLCKGQNISIHPKEHSNEHTQ